MRDSVVVESIQKAVVSLMGTTDLDRIRVVDVVAEAGIARSSFYRYYDSVSDVVQEMEDAFLDACRETVRRFAATGFTSQGLERDGHAIEQIFEMIRSNAQFYKAVTGPHGDPGFVQKHERLVREAYGSKVFFEGLVPDDTDLRLWFIMAGQTRFIDEWLTKHPEISAKHAAELLQRICYSIMHA